MIGRRKKQPPAKRTPHIVRQSQPAFQYSSNRSTDDHTKRQKDTYEDTTDGNPKRVRLLTPPVVAGLIVLLIAGVYFSLVSTDPKVIVAGDGQLPRNSSVYQESARNLAGGSWRNNSKILLDRQKLADNLKAQFPELSNVQVRTPFFAKKITFEATVHKPAALLSTDNGIYIVNSQGKALFDTKKERPAIKTDNLPMINDQSGTKVDMGRQVLTSVQMDYIDELSRQSEAKQLKIDQISLVGGGGELGTRYEGLPYFVKFNIYEDPRKSFGTFIATKEYIENTKLKPLEYIDVRVAERAYIK